MRVQLWGPGKTTRHFEITSESNSRHLMTEQVFPINVIHIGYRRAVKWQACSGINHSQPRHSYDRLSSWGGRVWNKTFRHSSGPSPSWFPPDVNAAVITEVCLLCGATAQTPHYCDCVFLRSVLSGEQQGDVAYLADISQRCALCRAVWASIRSDRKGDYGRARLSTGLEIVIIRTFDFLDIDVFFVIAICD